MHLGDMRLLIHQIVNNFLESFKYGDLNDPSLHKITLFDFHNSEPICFEFDSIATSNI